MRQGASIEASSAVSGTHAGRGYAFSSWPMSNGEVPADRLSDLPSGKEPDVADLGLPVTLGLSQGREEFLMLGLGGEVVDLVGIGLEVVQLLGGFRFPEGVLSGGEPSLVMEPLPDPGRGGLEHVVEVLAVDFVRHVVANIDVTTVGQAADQVVAFVHPVAKPVDVGLCGRLVLAQERMPLHPGRGLDPGQAQDRRRQVDEADQAIRLASGLVFGGRNALNFSGMYTTSGTCRPELNGQQLASWHPRAVVAVVEDDRLFGESRGVEFLESLTGVGVGRADLVVVLGSILADLGRIWVIGGDADLGRVVDRRVRPGPDLTFMTLGRVENREEGLVFWRFFQWARADEASQVAPGSLRL